MDEATARAQLEQMLQVDIEPLLDVSDIDLLLALARRPDLAGNSPTNTAAADTWAAASTFLAGAVIKVGTRYWRAVNAGVTGAAAPAWPDLSDHPVTEHRIIDGDVTWIDNGATWAPTWDLRAAAREGWRRKAAKASSMYDFTTDGQTFRRSMTFAQCMQMADQFRPRGLGSVQSR